MFYLWCKAFPNLKIHLENKFGVAFCRCESGDRHFTDRSKKQPEGKICKVCAKQSKLGIHRELGGPRTKVSKKERARRAGDHRFAELARKARTEKLSDAEKRQYAHLSGGAPSKKERTTAPKGDDFLKSWEWTKLRYKILKRYGRRCMCCGATPDTGAVMHVDHIKPRANCPKLALDPDNLQVLCSLCNKGKAAWDRTDWRPKEEEELPEGADDHMADIVRH